MTSVSDAEYEALTVGCGLVLLENWSVVTLTGEDRHSFLHNMCTNDIKKLAVGQGSEAFFTDVKGKIIAHTFVLLDQDRTYLLTVPEQAESIISHLDRYIIREDVQLANETESQQVFLIAGSESTKLLKHLTLVDLEDPWKNKRGLLDGRVTLLARFPVSARIAFLAVVQDANGPYHSEVLGNLGANICREEAWGMLRIESGLPLYGVDFTGDTLPQEVARNEQAISFTKGCYLGQETVARLDALGHVNKQLVTVKFTRDSTPEAPIPLTFKDKQVGEVTSVAWSPTLAAPIGIAMVRREANAVGTVLESAVGQVEVVVTPVDG